MKQSVFRNIRYTGILCTLAVILAVFPAVAEEAERSDTYWEEVAGVQQNIRHRDILKYGMTPIYANDIQNGTYPIEAVSDSQYFKIREAAKKVLIIAASILLAGGVRNAVIKRKRKV